MLHKNHMTRVQTPRVNLYIFLKQYHNLNIIFIISKLTKLCIKGRDGLVRVTPMLYLVYLYIQNKKKQKRIISYKSF